MSVSGLQTPFQRLAALPTTMNWRGVWDITQNYLLNDVVEDTTNNSTYILTGQIAITGGDNPVISPLWSELSGTSVGVAAVLPGAGILVDNSIPGQPEIINDGVLTISGGTGVVVDNTDPQNPVVSVTTIQTIQGGSGISVDSTDPNNPIVNNTGVRQIVVNPGTGLLSTGGSTPTLVNTGVLTVGGGIGIQTTNFGGNVQVTNTGVATLTQGNGIIITGPPQNPTIANGGVITVDSGDATISVDNTDPQNPIVIGLTNTATLIYQATSVVAGFGTINPLSVGAFIFGQAIGTIFEDYLANGAPESTGVFMIDLTSITCSLQGTGTVGAQNEITVDFVDAVTPGGPYTYSSAVYLNRFIVPTGTAFPLALNLGQVYFNVDDARTDGLRKVSYWKITNGTNGSLHNSSYGTAYAQYFPLGLQ
jgi:hypothetical protein